MYIPRYTVTSHLLWLIEKIASLKTRIEMSPISVPWMPVLTKDAFSRIAHSSTAIEGNPLTLKEVEMLASGKSLSHIAPRYEKEILNYFAALRFISTHKDAKTIRIVDILHLHELVGKEVIQREPLGAFRKYQVYVGGHKPPKASSINGLVQELLEWLNGPGQKLPAVLTSGILHYQLEYIHPFGDGNGRVGRLLANWELFRRQFDMYHIFSVDEVFWENRQQYYKALANVADLNGDLSGWLEFIAEAVDLTLERTWVRIASVRGGKKSRSLHLLPKQERLLVLLRESPMSVHEIQSALGVTRSGVHFLLKPLQEADLVTRVGGHKTGKYTLVR